MSETISGPKMDELRKEFIEYLGSTHPDWSDVTVKTHASDAFYAYNHDVGVSFWSCFISDEALSDAREKIRDYLILENKSGDAEKRADGYLSSMKYFKLFLDDRHPDFARKWSEESKSDPLTLVTSPKQADLYLKTAFQNWMKKQKKSDGEPYKATTINAYTNALKNSTAKLHLEDLAQTDLFFYTTPETFAGAYDVITSAPNFSEIDENAGNAAYSTGMVLYARFLKELAEPSCWIFQGNPKYYDVIGAVNHLDTITWAVNQNTKQIKAGDKAYIWVSGPAGGIVASGRIMCDPEMKEPDSDDPYWLTESLNTEAYLAVDIKIERKLTSAIVLREELLADERTKRLQVLTFPGATNYPVTKEQEAVIESIVDGTYVKIPISTPVVTTVPDKKHYWMYAAGPNSNLWEEFHREGIMGIAWSELGDLSLYSNKEAIREKLRSLSGAEVSFKNDVHAAWQFANEIKPGDVVFVKKGLNKLVGRGIVKSEYEFDPIRGEYCNIRHVDWTHMGVWNPEGKIVVKTLTDITSYTDYCRRLEELFASTSDDDLPEVEVPDQYASYSQDDFLEDVYMTEERYTTMKNLLRKKKNLIIMGAPGVGKTYAAERLAYSIMGEKDTSRVMLVQFHQSYSYEDFIMGYRPTDTGFSLTKGPFYNFCKDAELDDRDYFFIIDEINRGNFSKIFGELLMLIENDKRGKEVRLLYSDEQFSVPKNVHIIGMMNTADRSLAMIDYALRRRFAFFEFEPAFESDGFTSYQAGVANKKFDSLVDVVKLMNRSISEDASLGSGFQIGHSYFCTEEFVDDAWLSDVVEYELVPLIREYWFDEPSKVEQWTLKMRGVIHG